MPNPRGANQINRNPPFAKEKPYGAAQRQDALERSAIMAGSQGVTSAINAPENAQNAATRGAAPPGGGGGGGGGEPVRAPLPGTEQMPLPAIQGATPDMPYEVQLAMAWTEIAANPEASPLARRYADAAVRKIRQAQSG